MSSSPTHTVSRTKTEQRRSASYCDTGRHSNDWLFGGVSVRESIKHALHLDHHGTETKR
jgi:hypothetical protein